jgi:hypothetical protein
MASLKAPSSSQVILADGLSLARYTRLPSGDEEAVIFPGYVLAGFSESFSVGAPVEFSLDIRCLGEPVLLFPQDAALSESFRSKFTACANISSSIEELACRSVDRSAFVGRRAEAEARIRQQADYGILVSDGRSITFNPWHGPCRSIDLVTHAAVGINTETVEVMDYGAGGFRSELVVSKLATLELRGIASYRPGLTIEELVQRALDSSMKTCDSDLLFGVMAREMVSRAS